ncbi:unnamed protein product, partial [Amoebophrya sp. A120]|eukprot:GSA120T00022200001.1
MTTATLLSSCSSGSSLKGPPDERDSRIPSTGSTTRIWHDITDSSRGRRRKQLFFPTKLLTTCALLSSSFTPKNTLAAKIAGKKADASVVKKASTTAGRVAASKLTKMDVEKAKTSKTSVQMKSAIQMKAEHQAAAKKAEAERAEAKRELQKIRKEKAAAAAQTELKFAPEALLEEEMTLEEQEAAMKPQDPATAVSLLQTTRNRVISSLEKEIADIDKEASKHKAQNTYTENGMRVLGFEEMRKIFLHDNLAAEKTRDNGEDDNSGEGAGQTIERLGHQHHGKKRNGHGKSRVEKAKHTSTSSNQKHKHTDELERDDKKQDAEMNKQHSNLTGQNKPGQKVAFLEVEKDQLASQGIVQEDLQSKFEKHMHKVVSDESSSDEKYYWLSKNRKVRNDGAETSGDDDMDWDETRTSREGDLALLQQEAADTAMTKLSSADARYLQGMEAASRAAGLDEDEGNDPSPENDPAVKEDDDDDDAANGGESKHTAELKKQYWMSKKRRGGGANKDVPSGPPPEDVKKELERRNGPMFSTFANMAGRNYNKLVLFQKKKEEKQRQEEERKKLDEEEKAADGGAEPEVGQVLDSVQKNRAEATATTSSQGEHLHQTELLKTPSKIIRPAVQKVGEEDQDHDEDSGVSERTTSSKNRIIPTRAANAKVDDEKNTALNNNQENWPHLELPAVEKVSSSATTSGAAFHDAHASSSTFATALLQDQKDKSETEAEKNRRESVEEDRELLGVQADEKGSETDKDESKSAKEQNEVETGTDTSEVVGRSEKGTDAEAAANNEGESGKEEKETETATAEENENDNKAAADQHEDKKSSSALHEAITKKKNKENFMETERTMIQTRSKEAIAADLKKHTAKYGYTAETAAKKFDKDLLEAMEQQNKFLVSTDANKAHQNIVDYMTNFDNAQSHNYQQVLWPNLEPPSEQQVTDFTVKLSSVFSAATNGTKCHDSDMLSADSFCQTKPEIAPYLQIDFGDKIPITKVQLYARSQNCARLLFMSRDPGTNGDLDKWPDDASLDQAELDKDCSEDWQANANLVVGLSNTQCLDEGPGGNYASGYGCQGYPAAANADGNFPPSKFDLYECNLPLSLSSNQTTKLKHFGDNAESTLMAEFDCETRIARYLFIELPPAFADAKRYLALNEVKVYGRYEGFRPYVNPMPCIQ